MIFSPIPSHKKQQHIQFHIGISMRRQRSGSNVSKDITITTTTTNGCWDCTKIYKNLTNFMWVSMAISLYYSNISINIIIYWFLNTSKNKWLKWTNENTICWMMMMMMVSLKLTCPNSATRTNMHLTFFQFDREIVCSLNGFDIIYRFLVCNRWAINVFFPWNFQCLSIW